MKPHGYGSCGFFMIQNSCVKGCDSMGHKDDVRMDKGRLRKVMYESNNRKSRRKMEVCMEKNSVLEKEVL